MSSQTIDFSKINQAWKERPSVKADTSDKAEFEEVPDGNYIVFVEKVKWKCSRNGNTYLSWQLRIMSGMHEGRCIFKNSMCNSPDNMRFLEEDIRSCGGTLPEDDDLGKLNLHDLLDSALEVRKYTKVGDKGEFTNVYFNKHLGHRDEVGTSIDMGRPESARFNDEEIPF